MEYLGGILLENKFCHCVSLQFWNMDTIGVIERPVWSRLLYDCTDYFEMGIFFFNDLQKDSVNNTDEKNIINNWYSLLSKRKQLIQLDYLISSTLSPFHYVQTGIKVAYSKARLHYISMWIKHCGCQLSPFS